MRHNSERVRKIITDDVVPRTRSGGIAMCHNHQRMIVHYGGLLKYLCRRVMLESAGASWTSVIIPPCPRCGSVLPYYLARSQRFSCRSCHHHYSLASSGRYRCHKLPLKKIEAVADALATGESGLSVAKRLGVSIKSVYKIRDRARD